MDSTILAIIVPAAVAIASLLFGYLHNRATVLSERRKLFYEDRVRALSAVLESLVKMNRAIRVVQRYSEVVSAEKLAEALEPTGQDDEVRTMLGSMVWAVVNTAPAELEDSFRKNLLFLPPDVTHVVNGYLESVVQQVPTQITGESLNVFLSKTSPGLERYTEEYVSVAQKFMQLAE